MLQPIKTAFWEKWILKKKLFVQNSILEQPKVAE